MNTAINDFKKLKINIPKFNYNLLQRYDFTLFDLLDSLIFVDNNVNIELKSNQKTKINFDSIDAKFISEEIKENSKDIVFNQLEYSVQFKNTNFSLFIFTTKSNINVINLVRKICILHLNSEFKDNFEIYIFMLKDKKKFKGPLLTANSISSGFTHITQSFNKILIFREEELNKVLVHELIHCFNIDLLFKNVNIEFKASHYFNINPKNTIEINEAYTDFWAILINNMIELVIKHKSLGKHIEKEFLINFNLERKFTMFQAAKILVLTGFKNINQFTKKFNKNDNLFLDQTIPAFSYFFVKASMFYNINVFLKEYYLDPKSYKKIVLKLMLNKFFLKDINEIMQQIIKKKITNKYLLKTSRMTLLYK